MGNPHKHAELIKAWADGAEIEFLAPDGKWYPSDPVWDINREYRIKKNIVKTAGYRRYYYQDGDKVRVQVMQEIGNPEFWANLSPPILGWKDLEWQYEDVEL